MCYIVFWKQTSILLDKNENSKSNVKILLWMKTIWA